MTCDSRSSLRWTLLSTLNCPSVVTMSVPCADAAQLVGLPMMECRLRVLVACCQRELTLRADAPKRDCRASRTYGSWLYSNEYTKLVRCVIMCTFRSSCALKVRLLPLRRRGRSDAAAKPYEFFQARIPPSPLHIPVLEAHQCHHSTTLPCPC